MERLQSTIFIEFDVNTKKITFLRKDNIIDYDSNATSVYVRVKYKDLSGNTTYLTPSELEDYKFSLYTIKPMTNNINKITGRITDELKENVYGGLVKFEIPRTCTNRLGIVKCEIHIERENKMIASSTFVLDVKQSLVTEFDDVLLEDEDFPVLRQLILNVQNATSINDTTPSETSTYSSSKIENIKKDLNSRISSIEESKGMTSEQTQQLSTAYQHSQSTHAPSNAEANVQVDWNETNTASDSYIKNKPTNLATIDDIPAVPTKTSQLINDSGYITNVPDEYITETELNAKGYVTTSQMPTVPTNVSAFTNDANYASETFVTNKIAEASLNSGEVDLSGYVTKETGNANQITFADGQTFQAKLDAGILKGDKGEQGPQGIQGEKGDKGDTGADGLTTKVKVNGITYSQSNGLITLPDYPSSTGSTGSGYPCLTNVLSLGVDNTGKVDCTDIIHQALAEGKALYFPRGVYLMEYLELNSWNVLIGEVGHQTCLKPNTSTRNSFISIAPGPVIYVRMENFYIEKSPNEGQIGIDIVARFPEDGVQHGGLWYSMFKNISLGGDIKSQAWNGTAMRLIGSGSGAALPIQNNTFELVCVWANNYKNSEYIPLIIEGQVEQMTFTRCTFSGVIPDLSCSDKNMAAGVFRRRRLDDGSIDGDLGGASMLFLHCYFGGTTCCLSFERSRGSMFVDCYYENAHQLAQLSTVTENISIVGGSFPKCGVDENTPSNIKYVIEGDNTNNEITLIGLHLDGPIHCKAAHLIGCKFENDFLHETSTDTNVIKFNCQYSKIHFGHAETAITINTLTPHYNIIADKEYYLELYKASGKTVTFSSSGGNICNDLTVDIGAGNKLVKVSYVPVLDAYRVELVY